MSYGPEIPKSNLADLVIQSEEKRDYMNGQISYSDILYAHYTPCGSLYSRFRMVIPANWRNHTHKNSSQEKIDNIIINSVAGKDFKSCVESNYLFYKKRKNKLDEFISSVAQESLQK